MPYVFYKRCLDLLIAVVGITLLLPGMVILSILLVWIYKENPFFTQIRPGKHGRSFTIYKFKTLSAPTHPAQTDAERITYIGYLLRKYSVDELPQLLNVIKGDMSIIGPRPLLLEYLPLYGPHHFNRHQVKPGMTGWAQVHGRNDLPWEEKFTLDIWYVNNISFLIDLKIICLTLIKICTGEGVYPKENLFVQKYNK
ncbi:sugar transferase [Anditalea andensis]|uniref:Bacterial sugar transferase domain-containing protein n=1 Tax=Anditalea andensis TaxID=1048983 RepID=A0A074LLM2_9BACT|nr:sugar transferase [Anditalea andensis]KEO74757.1 hypothetical protein EL17_03520 [Anditalea andensis]